ncbi:hypothetical protein M0813_09591 [Anaeramoeba flamelloides]|uniref:Uncharacterized protein n=1 Tax=Anaeramoeba flamelloides TaxID=1746091 RepID=A0ABQ8X7U2_9EUKA|nr:hypothetical protein M0813_09591 [Anaeramoeba flamelloides]
MCTPLARFALKATVFSAGLSLLSRKDIFELNTSMFPNEAIQSGLEHYLELGDWVFDKACDFLQIKTKTKTKTKKLVNSTPKNKQQENTEEENEEESGDEKEN